jgi:hypothetical protein
VAMGARASVGGRARRRAWGRARRRPQLARDAERERRRLSDQAWKALEEEHRVALRARAAPGAPRLPTRAALERAWYAHWD